MEMKFIGIFLKSKKICWLFLTGFQLCFSGMEDLVFLQSNEKSANMAANVTGICRLNYHWLNNFNIKTAAILNIPVSNSNWILEIQNKKEYAPQSWACTGQIKDIPFSHFSFALNNGVASLYIINPESRQKLSFSFIRKNLYEVKTTEGGDPPDLPKYIRRATHPRVPELQNIPLQKGSAIDSPVVDFGILWTEEVEKDMGGKDAVLAEIHRREIEFNKILAQSLTNTRWRLVYAKKVDYIEGSLKWYDYMTNTKSNKNPKVDSIASLQSLQAIDQLCLIQKKPFGGSGQSAMLGGWSIVLLAEFKDKESGTLYHEFGHSMGCDHERVSSKKGSDPNLFNFAYDFNVEGDRVLNSTIMLSSGDANRHLFFSNPKLDYLGIPLGIPAGTADNSGKPISADNARWINEKGGRLAADYRKPGFHAAIDRKYSVLPPEGIQEFRVRISNTTSKTINIMRVICGIRYEKGIIYVSDGGKVYKTNITWSSYPNLDPGEVGNATIGKSFYFRVKLKKGDKKIPRGIARADDSTGRISSVGATAITYVDSAASINRLQQPKPSIYSRLVFLGGSHSLSVPGGVKAVKMFDIKGKLLWENNRLSISEAIRLPPSLRRAELGYVKYIRE